MLLKGMSDNLKKLTNTEHTLTQPLSVLGVWISPHSMFVQTHDEITTSSITGLNRLLTVGEKSVFEEKKRKKSTQCSFPISSIFILLNTHTKVLFLDS